jgi:tetratricopeptide (TPR) repeat protein
MTRRNTAVMAAVFSLGIAVGAVAAKKGIDPSLYHSKPKQEAGSALLELAKAQAGKGTWENIGVGRVLYLGGKKAEGQAIFDSVTAKKAEGGDWIRIGRVYYEAGEWDKAKVAFDKALTMEPNDGPWLAEVGAYYNLKGDRAKAEEMFDRSFKAEIEVWNTANIAGSYLGVQPLR